MFKITTLAGLLVLVCPTQAGQSSTACTLKCGTVVADGWSGKDEGSNDCNNCFCRDGLLGCTLMACETKACPPTPAPVGKSCTLRCGTVVADGWNGKGEGSNDCNNCFCRDGLLGCTKMGCETKACPPKKSCTLTCGTVVADGWSGKGEGSNDCNSCFCRDGLLGCTLMACETKACPPTPAPVGKSCTLKCGTVVADGWSGKDEGSNDCNTCGCHDGLLRCTLMACLSKPCPSTPAPVGKSCTLRCGTVVPHGWNGKGEGSNDCNSCFCRDGALGCTKMGCMTQSCPDVAKKCTLQCGTVVADGWTGRGEKSDHCNRCRCISGSLSCTRRACTPRTC